MIYNSLITDIRDRIPELDKLYITSSKDLYIDESTSVYVVFDVLFMPYITKKIIEDNDKLFLNNIFSFFDEMATCDDEEVTEVLLYTVLEDIGENENVYNNALKYMKYHTKELCTKVDRFLGRR